MSRWECFRRLGEAVCAERPYAAGLWMRMPPTSPLAPGRDMLLMLMLEGGEGESGVTIVKHELT